ncbi:MAG TPA: SMC-Scp complex subunit ScpB [Actinophytocola sp.]|nr:SMC-Scp complex subunit ScpB [Actinophytocola sp.]
MTPQDDHPRPADADPPTDVAPEPADPAELPEPANEEPEAAPSEPADADPPTEAADLPTAPATAAPIDPATDSAADSPTDPVADLTSDSVTGPATDPLVDPPVAPADADPPTAPVADATDATDATDAVDAVDAVDAADATDAADAEPPELTDTELECALEALLLVVDSPVEAEALADATGTTVARTNEVLQRMVAAYTEHERGLDLRHAGGGWRFYTRDRYAPHVEKLLLGGQRAKLTRAALETLAVIAYRQPVTRARVAAVRGVNCDGVIRTLLARGLVEETGTDVETGGFLYRTTELFLERLGLSSLEDLPPIAPLLPEVDSIDDI